GGITSSSYPLRTRCSSDLYLRSLERTLRHLPLALCVLLATVALNAYLFAKVPKGTVPQQDTGQLRGFVRGDDGLSFQVMQPKIQDRKSTRLNSSHVKISYA